MNPSEQIPASPNEAELEAAKHLTSIRISGRLAGEDGDEESSNEAAVDATDDADTRDGRVSRAA